MVETQLYGGDTISTAFSTALILLQANTPRLRDDDYDFSVLCKFLFEAKPPSTAKR